MLVELKLKNFKSFGEQQVFSLVANNKIFKKKETIIEIEKNFSLLPSVAIYGANASGKSNLLQALNILNTIYFSSAKFEINPFLLDGEKYKEKPSEFIFTYVIDDSIIEYEVHINSSFEIVFEKFDINEKFDLKKGKNIYTRRKGEIYIIPFLGNDDYKQSIKQLTSNNNLMLKVIIDNSGHDFSLEAKEVISIMNKLIVKSFDDSYFYNYFNTNISYRNKINKIITKMDLSIHEVSIKKININLSDLKSDLLRDFFKDKSEFEVPLFKHMDNNGIPHDFRQEQVSSGTLSLFRHLFRIVYCLELGLSLFADELEKTLHPIICRQVIAMFNNKKINKHGAQLIFTTHNVDLFDEDVFRKDQIYFVEKDEKQMSQLFSLNEFKSRNGEDIRKRYMNDRYGAIPKISDLEDIFND